MGGGTPPMAILERYLDVELTTGNNDGTSEADAWQSWADAVAGLVAGQRLNVQNPSSRYDVSGAAVFAIDGSGANPVHIRGYGSVIGDGVLAKFENFRLAIGGSNVLVEGIDTLNASAATTACFDASGYNDTFYNCKGVKDGASSTLPTVFRVSNGGNVVNCYVQMSDGTLTYSPYGLVEITNGVAYANVIRFTAYAGNDLAITSGIQLDAQVDHAAAAIRNVIYVDRGVYPGSVYGIVCRSLSTTTAGGYHILNNTIDSFSGGIVIFTLGGTNTYGTSVICNNLITMCPMAIHGSNQNDILPNHFAINNAYDGVVSGVIPIDSQRITQDPYADADNQDFGLNSDIGGGAVCRGRAANVNGTQDIGAIAA